MSVSILHSSDLHLGDSLEERDAPKLDLLAEAVSAFTPDLAVIAGDVFDHNRVPPAAASSAMARIDALGCDVVLLPGNHDCLGPDSVYERIDLASLRNTTVLGVGNGGSALFEHHDLEVIGAPHRGYADQPPLADVTPRTTRWRVTVAHGHWERDRSDRRRGWRFSLDDVARLDTDYLALGHWDFPVKLPTASAPAYYSGSPMMCGSVNLVHLDPGKPPRVVVARLPPPSP